jgi:hypothetical protein
MGDEDTRHFVPLFVVDSHAANGPDPDVHQVLPSRSCQKLKRRPHAPIWDSELGQIIVARLVFGFVTRRIWFTRGKAFLFPNTMALPP